MRYVRGGTVPRTIPPGRVLMHNHVQHTVDMSCGLNGFRCWTDDKPPRGFVRCKCGYAGLPHYRVSARWLLRYGVDDRRRSPNKSPISMPASIGASPGPPYTVGCRFGGA